MSKPATPGRKNPQDGSRPGGLTPAQRAIREAAEGLRNGTIHASPPPPEGRGAAAPPLAAPAEPPAAVVGNAEPEGGSEFDQPVRRRVHAMTGPLFDVEEIYVGCPAIDQILAYRDREFNVLATVEREFTDDSKVDALLAGDGTRHVDERWVVCRDDEQVFSVERYLAAEHPSYAVFDPTGTPLGAFVCSGGLIRRDVVVREGGSAPVAIIHVAHHRHVITETDGDEVGWCWRAFSGVGDDENEVWGLRVEERPDLLDQRVLLAAPLVCHLMDNSRRHVDRDCTVACLLAIAAPPVGLPLLAAERAVDALYWLRRHLD